MFISLVRSIRSLQEEEDIMIRKAGLFLSLVSWRKQKTRSKKHIGMFKAKVGISDDCRT